MAIQTYQDSFGNLVPQTFSTMLDRFFNDSVAGQGRVAAFSPQVDAYETEKGYQLEVALPGLKQNDIKVDFHQGRLTISGERSFRSDRNDRRYYVVENSYGSFQRSFQLPDTVNPGQIEASFEDGILHITLPKDEQKTMRHQIQVKGSQGNPSAQVPNHLGQQDADGPLQNASAQAASAASNGGSQQLNGSANGKAKAQPANSEVN